VIEEKVILKMHEEMKMLPNFSFNFQSTKDWNPKRTAKGKDSKLKESPVIRHIRLISPLLTNS